MSLNSAVLDVSAGDYFEVIATYNGTANRTANRLLSEFSIEVVVVANPPALYYDFGFAKAGTPTSDETMGKVVVARDIIIPADFAGAAGHVDVPPDDPFAIHVIVDAARIGTIAIDDDGSFTFATLANEAKEIGAGSVVRFVAPDPADSSIESIAVTILALQDT
jgi:hypothetical protein